MTYFEQALSAPELHFKRLRQAEPLLYNGKPILRRTYSAIEAEIMWNEHRYLLSLPLRKESLHHVEHLVDIMRERSLGPLIPPEILYDEVTLIDSLGKKHTYDIILQIVPNGMMLDEAVLHYKACDLRGAIEKMKERLDSIGFRHNNLTPANIVICESGRARPLRYWYAEWLCYSDNDISKLLDLIDRHHNPESEHIKQPLVARAEEEFSCAPIACEGITRRCKCGRYGFVDSDGHQITPFIYSWASDFCEGRAIVSCNKKFGAIDNCGRKVIPVIYKSLEFDVERGIFTATSDKYTYTINYEGEVLRRRGGEVATPEAISAERKKKI